MANRVEDPKIIELIDRMSDAIEEYEDAVGPDKAAADLAVRVILFAAVRGSKAEVLIPGIGMFQATPAPELLARLAAEDN